MDAGVDLDIDVDIDMEIGPHKGHIVGYTGTGM